MAIWFTSDWHLFHDKDFLYEPRGFNSSEEMTREMLRRHNEVVQPEDTVYVLGDIVLGGPITEERLDYLRQFNGKLRLAIGNHDTDAKIKAYRESGIFDDIQFGYRLRIGKQEWICTHYPTVVANGDNPKPILNIHGHTHDPNAFSDIGKCYNVNPEAHNCYPVSAEQIREDIANFNKN